MWSSTVAQRDKVSFPRKVLFIQMSDDEGVHSTQRWGGQVTMTLQKASWPESWRRSFIKRAQKNEKWKIAVIVQYEGYCMFAPSPKWVLIHRARADSSPGKCTNSLIVFEGVHDNYVHAISEKDRMSAVRKTNNKILAVNSLKRRIKLKE